MRILPIIQRISDQCPILLEVKMASGLVDLESYTGPKPAAYILSVKSEASASPQDIGVSQRIETQVGILLVAPNLDIEEESEFLDDARQQIFEALLGWQDNPEDDPLEYVSGQIVTQTKTLIWWQDIFVSRVYHRSQ